MEHVSDNFSLSLNRPTAREPNTAMAVDDIAGGFKAYKLWNYLAVTELRRRYRRTVIGPFWATLSIGIFILSMGFVLSTLWHTEIETFLPYFCTGYICWTLLSTLITEGCSTFISNESLLKQLSKPYFMYALLTAWKNFITFFHHFLVLILVLIYCRHGINFNILFLIPGMAITFMAGTWACLLLGILCARYRDIQQVIASILNLAMFVTPIMWQAGQLGRKAIIITDINPFYHFISIMRLPLMGEAPSTLNWLFTISFTILLSLITFELFRRKYRSIIFWL